MAEEQEQTTTGQVAPEAQPERNERFRWYILHAYSGFERKVRESIESRVQAFGLKDRVGRVMIPTEPVTEIVNGKSAPWSGSSCPVMCSSRWNSTTISGTFSRTRPRSPAFWARAT